MALTKINDEAFVDVDGLSFALFEDLDSDPKATIGFTSGQEHRISGSLAAALQSFLNRESQTAGTAASIPLAAAHAVAVQENESDEASLLTLARNKAWFYISNNVNGRSFFMAVVNAKGSCSLRMFEADTGIALPKQYRSGNYQDQFKDLLRGATELTVSSQPNLERDCKARLPQRLLNDLRTQLSRTAEQRVPAQIQNP